MFNSWGRRKRPVRRTNIPPLPEFANISGANSRRISQTKAGRKPGRRRAFSIFGIITGFFVCAAFWAVTHYEFGFYFDRVHSRGSRIYKINSYEQFMKEKAGDGAFLMA